ncbi:hypothetical protein EVAR_38665_1 [Eumeta japonica]|uniref:Uncharacterized protein n=1 Tax=Eumeta variegata TaxID=151549 RepID=A0A4C1XXV1_EUMVA|nr:hypothetical protein EVAR_38665_1 [Eumeta japonica]
MHYAIYEYSFCSILERLIPRRAARGEFTGTPGGRRPRSRHYGSNLSARGSESSGGPLPLHNPSFIGYAIPVQKAGNALVTPSTVDKICIEYKRRDEHCGGRVLITAGHGHGNGRAAPTACAGAPGLGLHFECGYWTANHFWNFPESCTGNALALPV